VKVRIALVCLLPALGLATTASAHESLFAPIIHSIDHLRWETNALRRQAGLEPIPTDFAYRANESASFRLEVQALWRDRLAEAREQLVPLNSMWGRLAECESNGNWRIDGAFDGGLQFHPGTWTAYRPDGFPRYAYEATPGQQVFVAEQVLAAEGWNAWPACSAALGLG
jgi:hypothetical protein